MLNKVILIGRLGAEPETRYMPNGNPVTNIRLATTHRWKDKQTGEKQERTEWHRVIFFSRLAEIAQEYLKTGSLVYIEGSLHTRKWSDNNGNDRYTTEITANELTMLSGKPGPDAEHHTPPQNSQQPPNSSDDFDDDIPF